MRIGIHVAAPKDGNIFDGLVATADGARDIGLATMWMPQLFDVDALTALAVVGREVPSIELGTAVTPVWPQHPVVMAEQALTAQAACGGRLALGLGLSHPSVVKTVFGQPFRRPARYMREYLEILMPLLGGGTVDYHGELLSASTASPMKIAGAMTPQVIVAALGPIMLKIAGELGDGTITWMVGPRTLAEHIVPTITDAAAQAGRPSPRIVVALPFCVTSDTEAALQRAARSFAVYGTLPSYRAMLDREGADGPADVAIIGDEDEAAARFEQFGSLGTTDLVVSIFGSSEERGRAMDCLRQLVRRDQ